MGYVQCDTDDLSGGAKPKVVAKAQMKLKQPKEVPTVRQSVGSDQTDIEIDDDPTPMKSTGALKRSYAMANVSGEVDATAGAQKSSKYAVTFSNDEYEIATGPEEDLSTDSFNDDEDPTPKKKPKKVSLREAVGAIRKEPEPRREQMKVWGLYSESRR